MDNAAHHVVPLDSTRWQADIVWNPEDPCAPTSRQGVLIDTTTGKRYHLATDFSNRAIDQASLLRYGNLHARRDCALHATFGLGMSTVVSSARIAKNLLTIGGCLLPGSTSLHQRASTCKESIKTIALQPVHLVSRELINLYGVLKPFEATALLAQQGLSGIDGYPVEQELDEQGFPLQYPKTTSQLDVITQLKHIFELHDSRHSCTIQVTCETQPELPWDKLTIDGMGSFDMDSLKIVKFAQVIHNMQNLESLSLTNCYFNNPWGKTVSCLFNLVKRNTNLKEILIKFPFKEAFPQAILLQDLFDSNPRFEKLEISIRQDIEKCPDELMHLERIMTTITENINTYTVTWCHTA